jgi:hypothetical protein
MLRRTSVEEVTAPVLVVAPEVVAPVLLEETETPAPLVEDVPAAVLLAVG